MKIQQLFQHLKLEIEPSLLEIEIGGLVYDSRKAKSGDVFVALKGSQIDGHQFINALLEKNVVIVAQKDSCAPGKNIILTEDTRLALALLSKAYFGNPDEKLTLIGITGTNGKTTTTYMIKAILEKAGLKTGIIGTIQYLLDDEIVPANNTTPESYEIYALFQRMIAKGITVCAMEISSHALAMNRTAGLSLDLAIFSNITQDHLDYHKTMAHYFQTKLLIFDLLKNSAKKNKVAILNHDIPEYQAIEDYCAKLDLPIQRYSVMHSADWSGIPMKIDISHNIFTLTSPEKSQFTIDCPMLGKFNIYNALCASAAAYHSGANLTQIAAGLHYVHVNGRFENIRTTLGFTIIVDYAHTPDALENVISTARSLLPRKVITVFGAGGNRDKSKRPKMGLISKTLSDFTIITSDNPRNEDPIAIINDIAAVFSEKTSFQLIPDREKAIETAIYMAEKGDIIIIAGKGHENYQIFNDKTIHFSDQETAKKYLTKREQNA